MSKNSFVDYIMDLLSGYGNMRARRMFGGYGIYMDKIIFAIIIDNEIYFKADSPLAKKYKAFSSSPFTYTRGGKLISLNYWSVPAEVLEDSELLKEWVNNSINIARMKNNR